MYLACTFFGPLVYLGPPFRRSRPSHGGGPLTVAFKRAVWRTEGAVRLGPSACHQFRPIRRLACKPTFQRAVSSSF